MSRPFDGPMEEARYYRDQMNQHYLTPREIGEKVGKDRAQVEATLQLLKLPEEIQNYVHQGVLQKEHGLVLAQVKNVAQCLEWGRRCIKDHLSATVLENLIKKDFN